jgi:parallel beta-helix repeat protein
LWPVLAGLALLVGPAWGQAVVYVDAGASGAGDGSSWADAFTSVQAGLHAADPGDQVWVAAGRYVENIMLVNRVALYGGFAGDEDPATFDLAERDLAANETILDGNQGLSVVGASMSVYEETRIDGFTITNGQTGMCMEFCSPTIANNTITGNGGDMYGAGLCLMWSCSTIRNNTITGNSAEFGGGGLYVWGSSSTIVNNIITGNSAGYEGGGVYVTASSSATIANNTITGNSAGYEGGGMYVTASSFPTIANNTIVGNSVLGEESWGGGLYLGNCSATIADTIVAFNSSGVHVEDGGDTILRHNCVYGNTGYDYSGLDDPTGTDGNISEDPLFVLTPGPGSDGEWGTEDDEIGRAHV